MQPNNLTALDFEDIKSSIKSYLRTRDEFTDYDFDGSSLSYLIDTLAYNTYYSAFTANMAMNEAFLPSATLRDNVVQAAKLLNYTPKSIRSSRACLKLDINTILVGGFYPSTITIKKGAICTGGNYIWNIINDITTSVNPSTGAASFDNVEIYEGALINYNYIVNTFAKQRYILQSQDADISTLSVRVKANETSVTSDLYSKVENITNLTAQTRAYFLSEGDDMRYEVKFGDDVVGRSVKDGEVVELTYITTSGVEANNVQSFAFIGSVSDSNGSGYTPNAFDMTVKAKSQLGTNPESVESIKFNAPRAYSAQYRAVTAQDYEVITKNLYDNAQAVVAYGGDSLNPPIYGKVFVAIKTRTGSLLNDQTKKSISEQLRQYAMASIEPVIRDPDNIYVNPKIFVTYDTGCGATSTQIKTDISDSVNQWATQTQINNFNATFSSQSLERAIVLSNKCISDVSLQITVLKYINPITNQTNTYCVTTGSPIYNSAPSQDADDNTECKKEPVIQSGNFRTADRPGVDQQFEDDGYGNLRTYYNSGNRKVYTNDSAGTVNYGTGEICFGPISVINTGDGVPADDAIVITDPNTGSGAVADPTLLPDGLQIPVLVIPSNNSVIPGSDPGTIINVVNPEVSVSPIGTQLPSTIPLNSLTPKVYNVIPTTIDVGDIDNSGSLNTSACFT